MERESDTHSRLDLLVNQLASLNNQLLDLKQQSLQLKQSVVSFPYVDETQILNHLELVREASRGVDIKNEALESLTTVKVSQEAMDAIGTLSSVSTAISMDELNHVKDKLENIRSGDLLSMQEAIEAQGTSLEAHLSHARNDNSVGELQEVQSRIDEYLKHLIDNQIQDIIGQFPAYAANKN